MSSENAIHKLKALIEKVLKSQSFKRSSGNYAFFSPFKSHYKPKLEIQLDTNNTTFQKWHCWISNQKGGSIKSLFKKLNVDQHYIDDLNKILNELGVTSKTHDKIRDLQITNLGVSQLLELPKNFIPLSEKNEKSPDYKNAIKYLKTRNIDINDIIRYNIGYCDTGEYAGRIIIPSYDENYNLNFFVARGIYEQDLSYKNPKWSKDIIGFENQIDWQYPIILCEGAFDAIAIKNNAIPLFGKSVQQNLKTKILNSNIKNIYLSLDNDAIEDAAIIAEEFLKYNINVYLVELNDKDPNKLGYANMMQLLNNSNLCTFSTIMKIKLKM